MKTVCLGWGGSCLGPLGVGCFPGHWNSSELNLFGFWTSKAQDLATSCRKVLYLIFLFVFNVLYTQKKKKHSRVLSLGNTLNYLIVFLITEQLLRYWSAHLCPSWIYCTGQQSKVSLFPGLFFCPSFLPVPIVVMSWIVFIIRRSLLTLHNRTIMSPLFQNTDWPFFRLLNAPVSPPSATTSCLSL